MPDNPVGHDLYLLKLLFLGMIDVSINSLGMNDLIEQGFLREKDHVAEVQQDRINTLDSLGNQINQLSVNPPQDTEHINVNETKR